MMQGAKKIDAARAKEIFADNGPAKLRAARAWLRWSLDDIAERSGIPRAYISYFENGRPALTENDLAKLLDQFLQAGLELTETGLQAL
jgi:transcriptional regulator with XRE-family HTH domain